jgi:hypothetical protein
VLIAARPAWNDQTQNWIEVRIKKVARWRRGLHAIPRNAMSALVRVVANVGDQTIADPFLP